MPDLGRRIDSLSPEKRALLERRLLGQRSRTEDVIPRRDRGEPCPLSFSQQRLWFLDQWAPGAPTYNAALPMLVRGPLDVEALEAALRVVIERHEALRTVFRVEDGTPVQVVLDEWNFELPVLDLRGVPEDRRPAEIERLLRTRARRPFDLAHDLMLRSTVLRTVDQEHVLLFEEHHIAFDGWSDQILFAELAELYGARLEGREASLPGLPIQYGDFAVWQRSRLQGRTLEEHVSYWRQQLAAAPAAIRLPTDRPRPGVQTFEGAHYHFELPTKLAEGVRELSREAAATPFMTLLAAFTALLYRWTGDDDVLVGSPIANRARVEIEPLIGFFSNTLVYRVRLGGNPSFGELVRRVKEVALGAYAHQDLPFEKVVEAVRPARDPGVNPLFQVNFRVQTGSPTTLELPGLEIEQLSVDVGFSRFDFALELQLVEDAIRGYVEYNLDLFDEASAVRFTHALERLLETVVERPDTPLLSLEFFGEQPAAAERRQRPIRSFRRAVQPAVNTSHDR